MKGFSVTFWNLLRQVHIFTIECLLRVVEGGTTV